VVLLAPLDVVAEAVAYSAPVGERDLALPAVMDYLESVNTHFKISKQKEISTHPRHRHLPNGRNRSAYLL
jgi:hypothetical protein